MSPVIMFAGIILWLAMIVFAVACCVVAGRADRQADRALSDLGRER